MKKKSKNVLSKSQKALPVHFEFSDPAAQAVFIAGTFNDWQPRSTPMIALSSGQWIKDLALLPGTYEYSLVVDGNWLPDKRATETVPNPYGGCNSIVKVGPPMLPC
jgi:1,4-alpha-glucan branching enzyme